MNMLLLHSLNQMVQHKRCEPASTRFPTPVARCSRVFRVTEKPLAIETSKTQLSAPSNTAKVFDNADSTKQSKTFFGALKIFYQTVFQQVFIRFNRINTKLFLSSIINRHINTILSIAPNSSRSEDLKQAFFYFHFITIFLPLTM